MDLILKQEKKLMCKSEGIMDGGEERCLIQQTVKCQRKKAGSHLVTSKKGTISIHRYRTFSSCLMVELFRSISVIIQVFKTQCLYR